MNRRTTELLLLIAASPVIILLFVLAIINESKPLNFETLAVPIGLFVAFILSHIAIRFFAPNADAAVLPIVFVLSGIGIAFVMRLAPEVAMRQVIWLFVSIAAMVLTLILVPSIRRLASYKYTLMLAGILLLLLPMFVGTEINGAKLWIEVAGYSFQPGEIAKVLVVLFLAGYLADNREMLSVGGRRVGIFNIPDFRTLLPLLIMWAISLLIVVFERDLGSALLFFGLFLVMLYISTGRKTYVIFGALLAVFGVIAASLVFSHVQQRIDIWLDPYADRLNAGWQIVQALYSLADGDLFGTGIGRGLSDQITYIESDLIFIAMAEELGLLGAAGILLLFMMFTVRGLAIAARAESDVGAFCATGLTTAIALQAFVIVGGVTKLIPLTGVTLPFMAQGGSSLLASFIIVGLLLRAGDSGTGHGQEMQGVTTFEGGILGRVTLGRRLTLLITGFTFLFAALIGNLTWHMVINAQNVREDPVNNHTIERNANIQRGAIVTSDNVVLAKSELDENDRWQRIYPQGSLASHVVGYSSPIYGTSGIEGTYADTLAGRVDLSSWGAALDVLADREVPGNDVYLTIDSRIQTAAEQALNGQVGGVVVLDATTGAMLAQASAPTYDNNGIEEVLKNSGSAAPGSSAEDNATTETYEGTSVLYNRATQGLYAPGSTFKTVTLTSALANGTATLESTYDSPSTINIGTNIQGNPGEIRSYGGYAYGNVNLEKGFAVSSNTVFAQVADQLGAAKLCATAASFGFNRNLDSDFLLNTSLMPDPEEMTQWETAWAGVGQPVGYHESPSGPQATVVQMAMVGAGIANNGTVMKPYLLDHVIGADGTVIRTNSPVTYDQATTPDVAQKVQQAMESVVREGTGTEARVSGYTVRGKTGTAETGKAQDNAWFVGYIEINERKIVVAIVLEEVPSGASTPKAGDIFKAAVAAFAN